MKILNIRAIVIKEIILKESDKIVILLSKDYGKISVSAKMAKNYKSKMLAGTQIFSYGDFILSKGKKYYFIKEIDIIKNFYDLVKDYDKLCYGNYFLEIVDKSIMENQECNEILRLLIETLYKLDKNILDNKLISSIFILKFMQYLGYQPLIYNCINCNKHIKKFKKIYFTQEGVLCNCCINNFKLYYININYTSLYAINFIMENNINKIFKFNLNEKNLIELFKISDLFLSKLELNLKSKKFIDIKNNKDIIN